MDPGCRHAGSALGLLLVAALARAEPLTAQQYFALSGPRPDETIAYGRAPSQIVELFLPKGAGPFPVAVLLHGGCWRRAFEGLSQMHDMAGALVRNGVAVWNVEYRRVDEGGGYPAMYLDVNAALAALRAQPRLDLKRIVAVGHSAGGQLAQWIVGRSRIPKASPIRGDGPSIREVVSLGGLADLAHEAQRIDDVCGIDAARLGGHDANAAELVPNGSHTVLLNGELDDISPPEVATDYAKRARASGDRVEAIVLPRAGHFDEVATSSPAWSIILPKILAAVGK